MDRPSRFEHTRFLGDKRTQLVYDLDEWTDPTIIDDIVDSEVGICFAPDTLAEAILPRGTVSLIALALGLVVAVLPLLWCQAAKAPIRGPPWKARPLRTGRDVLAHLCIARR